MNNRYKNIRYSLELLTGNLVVVYGGAYIIGSTLDSTEFSQEAAKWHQTGEYPFPSWLLFVIPRVTVWPIKAEVAFQVVQTVVWGFNGFILKNLFSSFRPHQWLWIPLICTVLLREPVQVIVGTAAFYYFGRQDE
jgi:hypothetical protein